MPTANQVAIELRKLADALDKNPEVEIVKPNVYFSCTYSLKPKEYFVALAKILPRPIEKIADAVQFKLKYDTEAIGVLAYIDRSAVCELIEPARPAVYNCPSLLSEEEEAALGKF